MNLVKNKCAIDIHIDTLCKLVSPTPLCIQMVLILATKEPSSTVGWAFDLAPRCLRLEVCGRLANFEGEKRQEKNRQTTRIKIELPCSGWLLFRLNTDRKISVMKVPIAMILSDMAPCQHNTSQPKLLSVCQNPNVEIDNLQAKLETWNWNPKSQCIHGPKNKFCVQHCGPWFSYDSTQWLKSIGHFWCSEATSWASDMRLFCKFTWFQLWVHGPSPGRCEAISPRCLSCVPAYAQEKFDRKAPP